MNLPVMAQSGPIIVRETRRTNYRDDPAKGCAQNQPPVVYPVIGVFSFKTVNH